MTQPEKITAQEALVALEAVVAEMGADYIYRPPGVADGDGRCFMVHVLDGEAVPGCLIGHVLIKHFGWPIGFFRAMNNGVSVSSFSSGIQQVPVGVKPLSEGAAYVLGAAQRGQDTFAPWGDALMKARVAYDENEQFKREAVKKILES